MRSASSRAAGVPSCLLLCTVLHAEFFNDGTVMLGPAPRPPPLGNEQPQLRGLDACIGDAGYDHLRDLMGQHGVWEQLGSMGSVGSVGSVGLAAFFRVTGDECPPEAQQSAGLYPVRCLGMP